MKRRLANDNTAMRSKKNDAMQTPSEAAMDEDVPPKQNNQDSSMRSLDSTIATTNNKRADASEDNDSYMYSDDEYSYTSSNNGDDDNEMSQGVLAPTSGSYCFCSMTQVKQFMESTVMQVSDLLCIPPESTVVLLRNYQWDDKKLTDDYFSSSSSLQDLYSKHGVLHRCSSTAAKESSKGCCAICMDSELDADDLFCMKCGHEFCKDCWSCYIEEALGRGTQCVFMSCPHAECSEVVTSVEVGKLTPNLVSKFQELELRSYIESNVKMRYCPGQACECVAVGSSADGLVGDGQCSDCGMKFCLECGEVQHTPASCQMMTLWSTKCQDESETAKWMLAKTRKCPKCDTRINKNGGCNHMTCTQCKYHFCWQCMQAWSVHGYDRSCNQFDLKEAQSKDTTRADAERELERYLFCYRRFVSHAQGQDFAQTELDKFEQKQQEREEADSSFEWNALKDALRQLVECRRLLKLSYVVTYCLADKPLERGLFEDHQGLLERFTEMLSEISEKDYTQIDRNELVNLTRTVEKYSKGVMSCNIDGGSGI